MKQNIKLLRLLFRTSNKKETEMSSQILNIETEYKSVKNYSDLPTGRSRSKVLIGDTDDARTSNSLRKGVIINNWPSWNLIKIQLDDGRIITFNTDTKTIGGKLRYIFFWNKFTAHLWRLQNERQQLLEWLNTAEPREGIVVSDLIEEMNGPMGDIKKHAGSREKFFRRIQSEIVKLSLRDLQKLNSLVSMPAAPQNSPELQTAA